MVEVENDDWRKRSDSDDEEDISLAQEVAEEIIQKRLKGEEAEKFPIILGDI